MIHGTQAAMIDQIVAGGLGPKPLPAAATRGGGEAAQRRSTASHVGGAVSAETAAGEEALPSPVVELQGGDVARVSTEGGGEQGTTLIRGNDEDTGTREASGELLRRQQIRIEELENRLLPTAVAEAAAAAAARMKAAATNAVEGCEHPTLTI